MKKKSLTEEGFTLIEVMIALTLFGIFISAFFVSQGYNISDSVLNEEQLRLQMLTENKMNEILINRPKFTNAMVDLKDTKTFEEEAFSDYEYTIEWKKLKVPDFNKIFNAQAEGDESESKYFDEDTQNNQRNSGFEKVIFDKLKENLEKVIWQVRITSRNKKTKYSYALSRWITNYDEPIQLNLGM